MSELGGEDDRDSDDAVAPSATFWRTECQAALRRFMRRLQQLPSDPKPTEGDLAHTRVTILEGVVHAGIIDKMGDCVGCGAQAQEWTSFGRCPRCRPRRLYDASGWSRDRHPFVLDVSGKTKTYEVAVLRWVDCNQLESDPTLIRKPAKAVSWSAAA